MKGIEFKTDNLQAFHLALKVIFDYLACLYIIKKLQDNVNVRLPIEITNQNPERFELSFEMYINSIVVQIEFGRLQNNDKILVKNEGKYDFYNSTAESLKECLVICKVSYLDLQLSIPDADYTDNSDKNSMKEVFDLFFTQKVRHKFYCWKYIRGFIYIFCTTMKFLKPYELLNVELNQHLHGHILMVRPKDNLQKLLDARKLYLEVLFQTMEMRQFDADVFDLTFLIRFHEKESKEFEDVKINMDGKNGKIFIADRETPDLILGVFTLLGKDMEEMRRFVRSRE